MTTNTKKAERADRREYEKCLVHDFCEDKQIKMEHINDFQIRLDGRLDVYPTAKKFCFLPKKLWGMYSQINDLCKKYLDI